MWWKKYVKYVKNILVTEKEKSDNNFERLKNNLIDSDNDMYLTVDSLMNINNITGSNNIT